MNGRFLGGYMFCDRSEYLIFARSLTIEGSFSQSMCQRNLVIGNILSFVHSGKKKLCRLFMKEDLKVSLPKVPSKNVI